MTERRFLDALAFCMLLPGPEAMQLATLAGWRLHGVRGGLVAGLLFVGPGAALVAGLAGLYAVGGDLPLAAALFLGVKAAVLVVVAEALVRVAGRALGGREAVALAAGAFAALFLLAVPFPAVVLLAALWGAWRLAEGAETAPEPLGPPASLRGTARTVAVWLAVWLGPLALVALLAPPVFGALARFFAVLATVTFGGAYAVLAFMAQHAVEGEGWLGAGEMLDALGLAETTPGPLILVTEFVGLLAAARAAPEGRALLWGLGGAAVTLWATFAPCFLWIFAGAPWIDRIAARPRLRGALRGVSAAVVGVIANLALWFALHVLFGTVATLEAGPLRIAVPALAAFDWRFALIALAAAVLLLRLRRGVPLTLLLSAGLGLLVAPLG